MMPSLGIITLTLPESLFLHSNHDATDVNATNMTGRLGSWNWIASKKITLSFGKKEKPLELKLEAAVYLGKFKVITLISVNLSQNRSIY